MRIADSLEKSLILGKIEGRRRGGCQRVRGLDGITNAIWANSGRWRRMGRPEMLQFMGSQRVRHDWANEQQGQSHLKFSQFTFVVLTLRFKS